MEIPKFSVILNLPWWILVCILLYFRYVYQKLDLILKILWNITIKVNEKNKLDNKRLKSFLISVSYALWLIWFFLITSFHLWPYLSLYVSLVRFLFTSQMWPVTYHISQLSFYPPIRQVTEELEGTATHLDSSLSAPFHNAPLLRQLLGPLVKFTLPLISLLMLCWCQNVKEWMPVAAGEMPTGGSYEKQENVRQQGKT